MACGYHSYKCMQKRCRHKRFPPTSTLVYLKRITSQLLTTLRMSVPSGLGISCTPLDYERSQWDSSISCLTRGHRSGLWVSKLINLIYVPSFLTRAQLRLLLPPVCYHCSQFYMCSCSFWYVILGNCSTTLMHVTAQCYPPS